MPIPPLDPDGYLPEGVHECTLKEVQAAFGSDVLGHIRSSLFSRLAEYITDLKTCPYAKQLIIDGSFTTRKLEPNDIDLIVILAADHDRQAELRPFEYNLLSRRRVAKRFEFDMLVARENSTELQEYVEFFQMIRGIPDRHKGLLLVQL